MGWTNKLVISCTLGLFWFPSKCWLGFVVPMMQKNFPLWVSVGWHLARKNSLLNLMQNICVYLSYCVFCVRVLPQGGVNMWQDVRQSCDIDPAAVRTDRGRLKDRQKMGCDFILWRWGQWAKKHDFQCPRGIAELAKLFQNFSSNLDTFVV